MRIIASLVFLTSLLLSSGGSAAIYKCKNPVTGAIEYRQTECSNQQNNIKYDAPPLNIETNRTLEHSNSVEINDGRNKHYEVANSTNRESNNFNSRERYQSAPNKLNNTSNVTYERAGSTTTPVSGSSSSGSSEAKISSETAINDIRNQQLIKLIAIGALAAFFVTLSMGLTNRVVIFYDTKDLMISLCVYLLPLSSLVIAGIMHPENPPEDYSSFIEYTIVGIGAAGALICAAISIRTSIQYNGMMLGAIVGIFKNVASIMMIIFAFGWLSKAHDGKYKSLGDWFVMFVVLGIFGWVVRKLINGETVVYQTELRQAQALNSA